MIKLDVNMQIKESGKNLCWYDASKLTIEGKGWEDTESPYGRLPTKAKDVVRDPVWELGKCSAGISIRFSTDSSALSVKWDGCHSMDHMTAVGCSGLDLYVKNQCQWKWLAVGRPVKNINETQLFADLPDGEREYMLYLPLYNPVSRIELGIPCQYSLHEAPPRGKKPIVFYGTSITQGGCASRPGMCYTAILGRWLDYPVINLGFSGNGIMEPEMIDLLCELDPVLYFLDNMPNMRVEDICRRLEPAIRKLQNTHPETPIVLVDNMLYCDAFLKRDRMDRYLSSNKAQFSVYDKLKQEGMEKLKYVKDDNLIGDDGEATVDGIHFTDLGYMRFSKKVVGLLKTILANS